MRALARVMSTAAEVSFRLDRLRLTQVRCAVAQRCHKAGRADAQAMQALARAVFSHLHLVCPADTIDIYSRHLLLHFKMSGAATEAEYGPRAGILAGLPTLERGVAGVTSASPDGKFFIYCNGTTVVVRSVEVCTLFKCNQSVIIRLRG